MSSQRSSTSAPQALHASVRDALRDRIKSGRYSPHSQIPSEAALCAEFRVSRITVRHALRDLEGLGHIFRIRGKGTFVSRPRPLQDFTPVVGFAEAMSRAGHDVVSKLLSLSRISAPSVVAARLGLKSGELLYRLRRIRYLDRRPTRLDVLYLPIPLGSKLVGVDLSRRDVFSFFQNELGIAIGEVAVELQAISADRTIASLLAVERGAPVLRIESLTYARDGKPLDCAEIYCRSNASRYGFWMDARANNTR